MIQFYKKKEKPRISRSGALYFRYNFVNLQQTHNLMGANVVNISECCNDSRNIPAFSYESGLFKIFNYNGLGITFKTSDGVVYVNATEMARPFGKQPSDWTRTSICSEFLDVLSSERGIFRSALIQVVKGGNGAQGTWMHEDVAIEFAHWLSPKFAIWCNDHIKELIITGRTGLWNVSDSVRADKAESLISCAIMTATFFLDKLGGPKASAAALVNKAAKAIGSPEIEYVPSKGVKFSATDLLKKFGRAETIHQFNKRMMERGLLEEKQRSSRSSKTGYKKFKSLTETGLEYGENEISPNNPNEVQPRYSENKFKELLKLIF